MSTNISLSTFVCLKEPSEPSEPSGSVLPEGFKPDGSQNVSVRTVSVQEVCRTAITLTEARAMGVLLSSQSGKLKYAAPSTVITKELLTRIKASKVILLKELFNEKLVKSSTIVETFHLASQQYENTPEFKDWFSRPFNSLPNDTGFSAADIFRHLPNGVVKTDEYLKAWQSLKSKKEI